MMKFGEKATYDDEEDYVSKSEIKRELQELRELGKELVELPIKDLDKLNLSERLYDQVIKAQGMKLGALKRQIGFIGGIMVDEEHQEIKLHLDKIRQAHNGDTKQFQQLEEWRDLLLAGDNEVMSVLRNQFDNFDMQHVRQLVRNANKETTENKPPKSARLIFKYLRECQEEQY
ncbi:hypothetical protein LCGC14_0440840 [marine sediment metagenome]|uniref:Ribosome-associated protein n=1 Tax=marine sediment metagenome TaxID=412755 RepID=A0A0F9T3M3_9ZZZZ|nr:DUF615 domain-containing protein [Methylophaga sp.]